MRIWHYITASLVLLSSYHTSAQVDEEADTNAPIITILPLIEYIHSDRPGNSFDPVPVKQGILVQAGHSYQTVISGYENLFSAQVRVPTCIGEFDLDLSVYGLNIDSAFTNDIVDYKLDIRDIQYKAGVWYRNGREWDKFKAGYLVGIAQVYTAPYMRRRIQNFYPDTIQPQVRVFDDGSWKTQTLLYLNADYSITSHWSVGGSLGLTTGDVSDLRRSTTMPLAVNLTYSEQWLSLFVESYHTDLLSSARPRINFGTSLWLRTHFTLDAYFTVTRPDYGLRHGIINTGFTYFIQ